MRVKDKFNKTLVVYGRKPVLEALQNPSIQIEKVHFAESNKRASILDDIATLAEKKNIAIEYRTKKALSFITKNSKQDQGVAADIFHPKLYSLDDFTSSKSFLEKNRKTLLLLDGVTNPQNLGMIIRSTAASGIAGLILPQQGCADLGPLTIKASAGAVFRCPIIRTHTAGDAASSLKSLGGKLIGLDAAASNNLFDMYSNPTYQKAGIGEKQSVFEVFVLGNETDGISKSLSSALDSTVNIPMHNGVESLNVAVAASLVAYFANSNT